MLQLSILQWFNVIIYSLNAVRLNDYYDTMCSNWDMDENVIFRNDCLTMRIQQKTKVESLLKWLNLILYPSKHGDKHQNYFDTMRSDWDIDETRIFRNGGIVDTLVL